MKKIMDSEIDIIGRIGIFLTMCAATVLLNSILDAGYKETAPYIIQLIISFIAGVFGLICVLMVLAIVMLFAMCLEWVFTGDFGGKILEGVGNVFNAIVTFLVYFLYGNWWRGTWKLKKPLKK